MNFTPTSAVLSQFAQASVCACGEPLDIGANEHLANCDRARWAAACTPISAPTARRVKLGLLTASELMNMQLPPVRYILEGYIAEGLTILAGRPKLGKSWLALDIGIAVAMGGYALNIRADQGDVLYLALEDNRRRMQKRLRQILQSRETPSRLCIDLECPRR
jgi:AAA domain-containing protein